MDWINVEFIESVAIDTIDNAAEDEDLATICNQLLEMTDKLESFTIFPIFSLVRLPFLTCRMTQLTTIGIVQSPLR